jgi:hypothetical protein
MDQPLHPRYHQNLLIPGLVLLLGAIGAPAGACGEGEARRIFDRVADLMHVRVEAARPCPQIVLRQEIAPERFSSLLGLDTNGRVFPAYIPSANLIVVEPGRPDLLAHELVHYFQVVYWGVTENDPRDTVERQATAVEAIVREEEAGRP